jgi:arylformamidase
MSTQTREQFLIKGTPYSTPWEIDLQFDLSNHQWDQRPYGEFLWRYSDLARKSLNNMLDIRVGTRDEERIDVYPASAPGAPILIFVHGGWWRRGTRKDWSFPALGFVKRGYTVIISDYTLCPKVTIPDITQATRAAVVWAYENAASINGDPNRLFLTGHSAGGQQAAMMAITDWTRCGVKRDVLKGIAPISAIFDMRVFQYSWIQGFLQLTGNMVESESALFNIPEKGPPLLITLGEEESAEFHRQAEMFHDAWQAKGNKSEYYVVPGEDHPTAVFTLANPESEFCDRLDKFFQSCV